MSLSPRTLALGATLSVIAACSSSSGVGQGTGVAVTVSPAAASLAPGWSQLFTATVTGASDGSVAWGVVEPGGGQVDASGRYTAPQATGSYHVRATSVADPGRSATASVSVTATPVVNVTVSPASAALAPGRSQAFTATVTGSLDASVAWSVVEAGGGQVDAAGLYTAPQAAGSYHVRATSVADASKSAEAAVTVSAPPAVSVTVSPASVSLAPGGSQAFTAAVTGTANVAVTWSVVEAGGGQVDAAGLYTAPSVQGTYHVLAASVADPTKSARAVVSVSSTPAVVVAVSPAAVALLPREVQTFSASVSGAADRTVTWSVAEGAAGGTIDSLGAYEAPATTGSFHVVATSNADPQASATAAVTVSDYLAPSPAPASDVQLAVTSLASRPISRFIYGLNFLTDANTWSPAPPAGITLSRMGGNRLTAFNWETSFSNAGSDYGPFSNDNYLCLNVPCPANFASVPGSAVKARVDAAFAAGAAQALTVPVAGYVSLPVAGLASSPATTTPDPRYFEPMLPVDPAGPTASPPLADGAVYADDFVKWVETTYPAARTDPQRTVLYILDNEPQLWWYTHPELLGKTVPTEQEVVAKDLATAVAIKSVAPQALVLGPASWGWQELTSFGWTPPTPAGYGWFLDYYLDQARAADAAQQRRVIDVFDMHFYSEVTDPDAGEQGNPIRNDPPETAGVIQARVQAPRSLWDPSYVEGSWIPSSVPGCASATCPIMLIPRVQQHIDAHYPGTGFSITERYYGGGNQISGAIAEADVLGIFGRTGLFAAALWPYAFSGGYACILDAFRVYVNYDGQGSRFGDTSIGLSVTDPQWTAAAERVSAYASVDQGSPGRMLVVAINKTTGPLTAGLAVTHTQRFAGAQVWRVSAAGDPTVPGCSGPAQLSPIPITLTNAFQATLPALSVTLFVLQ